MSLISAKQLSGTKAQFDAVVSDGNFAYQSDLGQAGISSVFYYKTASDVATFYKELNTPSVGGVQTFVTGSLANSTDTIIATFITEPNFPNTTFIQPGVVSSFITAKKSASSGEDVQILCKWYSCNSVGGSPVLLATSSLSIMLTDVDQAFVVQGAIPTGVITLATDRRYVEIIARTGSSGATRTVTLSIEDTTASRTDFPFAIVSGILPILGGGTGASTASDARTNLGLGSSPVWTKYTISYTAFTAAATSESIELFSNLTKQKITGYDIRIVTAHAGTGFIAATLEIGIVGTTDKHVEAYNSFATSDVQIATNFTESFTGATSIKITSRVTGGNLSAGTAGSFEIYIRTEQLP